MLRHNIRKFVPIAAACMLAGCETVPINPNDASAPTAEVLVKQANGPYVVASATTLHSGGQVKLMCRITDPQGVKYVRLSFQGGTSSNCTVGSTVWSGSFPLQPPPPAPMEQTLSGSSGQVPTVLPLMTDINDVSCTVFGQQQPGRPLGHTIVAKCDGKNWSSNLQNQSSTAELQIKIQ